MVKNRQDRNFHAPSVFNAAVGIVSQSVVWDNQNDETISYETAYMLKVLND